jgi:hypothetical protein
LFSLGLFDALVADRQEEIRFLEYEKEVESMRRSIREAHARYPAFAGIEEMYSTAGCSPSPPPSPLTARF